MFLVGGDIVDSVLLKVTGENNKYLQDLSKQSREIGMLQEQSRKLELEVRLLRERDAASRAERRFVGAEGRDKESAGEEKRRDSSRADSKQAINKVQDGGSSDSSVKFIAAKAAVSSNPLFSETVQAWESEYQGRVARREAAKPIITREPARPKATDSFSAESGSRDSPVIKLDIPKGSILLPSEQIQLRHDRLQKMYDRVTKGVRATTTS